MNGFRKNKGIIIELTSLLDIIMIMLFWVMLNVSTSADTVKEKAKEEIAAANSASEQAKLDAQQKLDDMSAQNVELQQNADNMKNALDGFENGMMLSLEMKYENGSDIIYVSQNGNVSDHISVDSQLSENLKNALSEYGLDDSSVILAAFMYDGNTVLYRDVDIVQQQLDILKSNYDNIYFTDINTTE